jgi:hypothetical protein
MGITVAEIRDLVARFGNDIVVEQAYTETPFVGKKKIKRKNIKDRRGVVNVKAGPLSSIKFVRDYGTLPQGGSKKPRQGYYDPVGIFGRIEIPRIAAKVVTNESDGINIVKEQMDACAKGLGLALGAGVIGASMGSPAAQVLAGATTFTVNDPSPFRVGIGFEIHNTAVPTIIEGGDGEELVVQKILMPADGVGLTTITFTGQGVGGGCLNQWETTYKFFLRGSQDADDTNMTDLEDVAANAALYNLANTSDEWHGNLDDTPGPLTIERLSRNMVTYRRRRGKKPSFFLCNSRNMQRYDDQLVNNRRFANGKMDAQGDIASEYQGVPFFIDEIVKDTDVYMFNDEDIFLHVFSDFEVEMDGGSKKGMDRGSMMVSSERLIYDTQVLGIYNTRVERRNGLTRITNITD